MSEREFPTRPPCLKCGSRNVAWIQWGRPDWRDGLEGQLDRNEVTLGSCFMTKKGEVWECNECKHRFGSHSFMPLVMRHKGEEIPLYMQVQDQAWLHYETVSESKVCGCYHCLKTFTRWDITEWITDIHKTPEPLCPYCQQDSVIGDALGYPLTEELLGQMREYCYEKDEWWEDNDGRVRL